MLTALEKRVITGSAIIGTIVGGLLAYAVFAFTKEFEMQQGISYGALRTAVNAALAFFMTIFATVCFLGIGSIFVIRWLSNRNPED